MTQLATGEAWLTTSSDVGDWRALYDDVVAPTQETQRPTSVTLQPEPEVYAHHVALAVEILRRKEIDKVVLARAVLGTVPERHRRRRDRPASARTRAGLHPLQRADR